MRYLLLIWFCLVIVSCTPVPRADATPRPTSTPLPPTPAPPTLTPVYRPRMLRINLSNRPDTLDPQRVATTSESAILQLAYEG